jgi:hypothetical protein
MSEEDDDVPPVVTGDKDEPEVCSTYTRAEALSDGMLIDVTARAREAGIQVPIALTRAVWNAYVELTPAATMALNNIEGRCWDIIWMFRSAALAKPNQGEIHFQLYVVTDRIEPLLVTLKAICYAGDDGEPVVTILLPDED